MSDTAILRNTVGPLEVTFYSGETAIDADGTVLVGVVGLGGSTIVTGGTASAGGTAYGTGVYLYDLDPQATLDLLSVTWSGTFSGQAQSVVTTVEVQGGFHVSIPEIRALSGLSSTTTYPFSRLAEVRRWWETLSEDYCDVAFVPRAGYDVLDGDGSDRIHLDNLYPRSLVSVTVDDVARTTSDFELYDSGLLLWTNGRFTTGERNVVVRYDYGLDELPSDLHEEALVAIRDKVLGPATGIPERAASVSQEYANVQLAIVDEDHPTGIPRVDAALRRHRQGETRVW